MAVTRHIAEDNLVTPPLAVGRMAVDSSGITDGAKGKAVYILHIYGDNLWEMGAKTEPPQPTEVSRTEDGSTVAFIPNFDTLTIQNETTSTAESNIATDQPPTKDITPDLPRLSPQGTLACFQKNELNFEVVIVI